MKRVIFTIAIALFASLSITACTEEEIVPTNTTNTNGGTTDDGDRPGKS